MGRVKLTKQEIIALLVTIRAELKILFEELGLKQSIVSDLTTLIEKEFNIDPESREIYEIFDK
jgi:hypothetical protein